MAPATKAPMVTHALPVRAHGAIRPDPRTIRTALIGLGAVVALLAFPRDEVTFDALFAVIGWATFVSLLTGWLLRKNAIATATIIAAISLAYTQGLGDAAESGMRFGGFQTSPSSVALAVLGVGVFLWVTALVSRAVVSLARLRWGEAPPQPQANRNVLTGVVLFLGATLLAAIATGAWSYWGDRSVAPSTETGLIRLELFYSPTLIVCIWFATLLRRDEAAIGATNRTTWRIWVFAGVVAIMLFALQSRRLMVGAGLMLAFTLITTTPRTQIRSMVWRALGLAATLFAFSTASAGWRELATESRISISERFEGALESVGDTRAFEQIESRLTYLWFDAVSHELAPAGIELSMSDLAISNLARAVPRALFPSKDEVEAIACENFLDGLALPDDLPCTPSGEGVLWAGFWGILFVGLIAGINLGVAELLIERNGIKRVVGLFLLVPFAMLETGAFGFISGLRLAFIGTGFIAAFALAERLLAGQRRRRASNTIP